MYLDLGPAVNHQPGYRRDDSQSTPNHPSIVHNQIININRLFGESLISITISTHQQSQNQTADLMNMIPTSKTWAGGADEPGKD